MAESQVLRVGMSSRLDAVVASTTPGSALSSLSRESRGVTGWREERGAMDDSRLLRATWMHDDGDFQGRLVLLSRRVMG